METLKQYIQAGVDSLTREQSEKDYRSELGKQVKDQFDIPVAEFNKKVKVAFDTAEAIKKKSELEEIISEVSDLGF